LVIPENVTEKPSSIVKSEIDSDYISGVAKLEEKLVIILDLEKVLNTGVAEAV